MTIPYLSKSDFKIACSCSKKLIYKKLNYPTNSEGNEFIEMLAEGGYLIGKYATLHYPEGIEMGDQLKTEDAIQITKNNLEKDCVILFEAAFKVNQKMIRVDILEKNHDTINLIEVKSKSYDSIDGTVIKDLAGYLEDIAFQKLVVQEAYPNLKINCFIMLPDKSKVLELDELITWFNVKPIPLYGKSNFRKPEVNFIYEIGSIEHQKLIENSILCLIDVNKEVNDLMQSLKFTTNKLIDILNNGISNDDFEINKNCFSCEYKTKEVVKNGFKECWGELADVNPSISSLYHLGTLGGQKNPIANQMIKDKKVSFFDLQPEFFYKANSTELSSRGLRQLIQYENTINNTEWFSPEMKTIMEEWKYPLHFIDFETYTGSIPHHKGLKPFETIAFQWSCHTIHSTNQAPVHSEWINTEHNFPNFRFAETLMIQIGDSGTPLMWATHENTVLRSILTQMENFGYHNPKLKKWLIGITKDDGRNGRLIDMNAFTLAHYFHPKMEGKTSIKKVLPAIWNNNSYLHAIDWLMEYVGFDLGGVIKSPYDELGSLIAGLEEMEAVKDGTGALKAYHEMQFGNASKDEMKRETLKKLLLQYCKLDTMAMVIIWKYWKDKLNYQG